MRGASPYPEQTGLGGRTAGGGCDLRADRRGVARRDLGLRRRRPHPVREPPARRAARADRRGDGGHPRPRLPRRGGPGPVRPAPGRAEGDRAERRGRRVRLPPQGRLSRRADGQRVHAVRRERRRDGVRPPAHSRRAAPDAAARAVRQPGPPRRGAGDRAGRQLGAGLRDGHDDVVEPDVRHPRRGPGHLVPQRRRVPPADRGGGPGDGDGAVPDRAAGGVVHLRRAAPASRRPGRCGSAASVG